MALCVGRCCLSRIEALPFMHACLALQQALIRARSVMMPIRQAPGTAPAVYFVDAVPYCMLPVRMATSDVLHAMQNSTESF